MGTAEVQGVLWGRHARDWADLQEPQQERYYAAVFDAIGVVPGSRVLDAGCGSGYALTVAAVRGARPSGFDASEPLVQIARERLPEADLRVGELEELPYGDASFDVVTAFNSVQYSGNPSRALQELARVAVPGGPVAVVTWGDPERCEYRAVLATIGSLLPPPPPGAGGPFALSVPGALESLVEPAGLTPVEAAEVATAFDYADVDTAYRATRSSGPAARAIDAVGEDAFRAAVAPVLEAHRRPDGHVRFENAFRYLISKT